MRCDECIGAHLVPLPCPDQTAGTRNVGRTVRVHAQPNQTRPYLDDLVGSFLLPFSFCSSAVLLLQFSISFCFSWQLPRRCTLSLETRSSLFSRLSSVPLSSMWGRRRRRHELSIDHDSRGVLPRWAPGGRWMEVRSDRRAWRRLLFIHACRHRRLPKYAFRQPPLFSRLAPTISL